MILAAARLPVDYVEAPALLITLAAVIVLASGVLALARKPMEARALIASRAGFALELLLAAGLLRLASLQTLKAYAMVASIIFIRQLIKRGITAAAAPRT